MVKIKNSFIPTVIILIYWKQLKFGN